jgi:hypothetical protein
MKNLGYKMLSIVLTLVVVVIVIAYSPRAYIPIYSNTATLNFPSTAAGASSDLTITITGAALNDVVIVGVPNGSTVATGCFTGWVSASNTVTVRFSNTDVLSALDPASGTFRATIIKQ